MSSVIKLAIACILLQMRCCPSTQATAARRIATTAAMQQQVKTPWELWAERVEKRMASTDERLKALESHTVSDNSDVMAAIHEVKTKIDQPDTSVKDWFRDGSFIGAIVTIITFLVRQHYQVKSLHDKLPETTNVTAITGANHKNG